MKKTALGICAALIALIAIGMFGLKANASSRGEQVTMELTVSTYSNVSSGAVSLSFDTSVLEIVSGQMKVGSPFDSFTPGTGKGVMGGTSPFTVSGNILSVTFKIKDNAPFTSTTVTAAVTIRPQGGTQIDDNYTMGTVTVTCTHSYGSWTKQDDNNHIHTCSICSGTETQAHTWNVGTVTKQATCKEAGIKTFTCTACSATKTEEIAKTTTHTWGSWTKVNDNQHKRTCAVCSQEETKNHTWNSGTVTKAATCKEAGAKTFTCTACNATKTEVIVKTTTHTWGSWSKVNDNQHKHTCTVCNLEETANHGWNAGVVTKQATCKEAGVKTYTCTACNTTKTEEIAKTTTHTFGAWTKSSDTEHKRTCSVCDKEETQSHSYSAAWQSDAGSHYHICSVCGDKKDNAAHTPGAAATESKPQTCTTCGRIITPALGHKHNWSTEWAMDESGHWVTCSGCNEKKDASEHAYDNGCDPDCNICGFTRTTEHQFEMKSDETSHWQECKICGETKDKENHVPGQEATATDPQVCLACGYVIEPAKGEAEMTASEVEDESKDETAPAETESQKGGSEVTSNETSWPWIFGGIGVLAIIAVVVVLVSKKRKGQ